MSQRRPHLSAALATVVAVLAACSVEPTPTLSPAPSPSTSPTPTLAADLLDRPWTVLFAGIDLNDRREREGLTPSTDALLLVHVSADGSRVAMVSLPRDTVDVPLPDGGTWTRKINALYNDQGIGALVGALETLYELPIDAHVVLDMEDFTRIVDAVGGIEVAPEEPLRDRIVRLRLKAGPQTIDAATANGYVRSRVDQDYGRMARQQEVLLAIVERLVHPGADLDVADLARSLESLETDLPLDELPTLLELARRAVDADLESLVIEPPLITFEGDRGDGRGYVLEPDIEAIRAEVASLVGE